MTISVGSSICCIEVFPDGSGDFLQVKGPRQYKYHAAGIIGIRDYKEFDLLSDAVNHLEKPQIRNTCRGRATGGTLGLFCGT